MGKKNESAPEETREENTVSPGMDLRPLPMVPSCGPRIGVVGVHPIHDQVEIPSYQTDASGCFDLAADLSTHNTHLRYWDAHLNREGQKKVRDDSTGRHILLEPGDRVLVPTGLILVMEQGFSVNTFIRSGTALKKGIRLVNAVGYIDEDYRGELFLPIINDTKAQVRIDHQERIAQAEVRPYMQAIIEPIDERPSAVGNRNGGFGSTGSK